LSRHPAIQQVPQDDAILPITPFCHIDEVRRSEMKKASEEMRCELKGQRYLLLKRPWRMDDDAKADLCKLLSANRLIESAEKCVCPQAEMSTQFHGVIGGDFPLAAQDHGTERKRLAQDAGQIGSHKTVLFEQVLEKVEGTEVRHSDGFLFPLFDQVAEQIEVVVLVCRHLIFEAGENVGDLHGVPVTDLVMNGAGKEHAAKPSVIRGHRGEVVGMFCFHRSCEHHRCISTRRP